MQVNEEQVAVLVSADGTLGEFLAQVYTANAATLAAALRQLRALRYRGFECAVIINRLRQIKQQERVA
ncbi:hypothetical protein [Chrysiogenes arsenatis]|uniref:hypothetical protein n=1 Tax=Chrysiogenes arsenatis TaxID=309797 RepID=UPI0003FE50E4|nr:hypothetical protein [Chrysiogenes arsenatis]